MSNYHILETNEQLSAVRVCYHVSIPDENNSVSNSLRAMVVYHLGGGIIESRVPGLEDDFATEYANLSNGSIYENSEVHRFSDPTMTLIQKRSELDARYTAFSTSVVDKIRAILKYYRLDRNVP